MANKLKLGYDNYEDAKTKLTGTYCLYKGKAFTVKQVWPKDPHNPDAGEYSVLGTNLITGHEVKCSVDDPEFNCSDYNIGYYNLFHAAVWFYRVPVKQWKQGLHSNQVMSRASNKEFYGVGMKQGKQLAAMLQNEYPTLQSAAKMLKDQEATIVAFHRNFAITLDRIHDDFIVEYKGECVGHSKNLEDFILMPQHQHLAEALKEAIA